jgi:shikimate kinase
MKKNRKILTFIGFQASGKTTIGQLLAAELQLPFIDTDQLIEQFHPPLLKSEIFKTFGDIHFRNIESQAIASLNFQTPFVLATGGGSLLQSSNGIKLKERCILIYLKTSLDILKERIWKRNSMPSYLPSDNPHDAFDRLYHERIALYENWADHVIEMDGLHFKDAIDTILKRINQS